MGEAEEGPPWAKLLIVCASLAIAAGLTPASSAYTDFFSQDGICANFLCKPGENKCAIQEAFIGQAVLAAGVIAKMMEISGAYSYQQYGAKRCLQASSNMHMVGWVLFLYNRSTNSNSPINWMTSIYLIDMSRGLIKYVPYAFLTHFPGQTGTVLALGNGGHQAASVFALFLIFIVKMVSGGGVLLAAIQSGLGVALLLFGPSLLPKSEAEEEKQEETQEDEEAEKKKKEEDDAPPPPKKGACDDTCAAYKDTFLSLAPKFYLHLFVVFTFGVGPLWSAQYQAICVVWGNLLFHSSETTDTLASSIPFSTFFTNCAISPVVAAYLPKVGLASVCLVLSLLQLMCIPLVPIPSLLAQLFIGFVATLMYAVEPALQGEHLFAFVDLRFAGMAAFIWSQFMFAAYSWGTAFESYKFTKASGFDEYHSTLRYVIQIGAYSYGVYSILMFLFPLPDRPAVASHKQAELSRPFGCTNFEQVAKIIRYNLDLTEKSLLQQQARDERSLAELTSRSHIPSLRNRLVQLTYDETSKLVVGGNLFWKPTHVPVKSTGFMMAGVALPAAQFESMLRSAADVDAFGSGHAKSLAFLKEEMANKRSSFEFDEENPDMLVRVVTIIVLRITLNFQGSAYFLLETGSLYTDDSVKKAMRYPAAKKMLGGAVDAVIKDLLKEIGIDSSKVLIDKENPELLVEKQPSESYPGLLTRYDKKLFSVLISAPTDDSLSSIGLTPEPVPWQIEHHGWQNAPEGQSVKKADMFEWLRREDIRERAPSFMVIYPKPKSNRPSPESLGMDLHTMLKDRKHVVELLHSSRNEQDWKVKEMLSDAKTADYIRSLPYWLLDEQFQYHNKNILTLLKNMLNEKQKPPQDVLIESLILDLMVYKFKAKLRRRKSLAV